ncbi:MAG: uroporphyrinogen decarboxylase family protein [Chloroflexota bacterium]|nr:uroporphyrinogen decarboxylase family protein [Chloroflexota bacterium]
MNSKERLVAAIKHEAVDRVPFNITYYMPAFYEKHFQADAPEDPLEARLASQTRFGFDPLLGLGGGLARPWRVNEPGRWEVREEETEQEYQITYRVSTPAGALSTTYYNEPGKSGWQEAPLVKEEDDLRALEYLPTNSISVAEINERWTQLGDRGLGYVSINGIWQQACYLRGMNQMAMDPYLRPQWATEFLERVADYLAAQAEALCRSSVEAFFINESYVGMGISKSMFDTFVRPFDERFIRIAKEADKLVLYHDCGLCDALLESFADMGIDYLEPLNPEAASGDVDPADAKRRIGDRVCLRGGFNHQLMSSGTPEDVRAEVKNCLQRLAPGGGYILSPAAALQGNDRMENLVAYAEAATEYCGQYGTMR